MEFLRYCGKGTLRMERDTLTLEEEAESICRWGAARAGVVVIDPRLLIANEVYMIIRIARVYGVKINNKHQVTVFIEAVGGVFVGRAQAFIFPPMKFLIGIGGTYALGKAAQAWIKDGMPVNMDKYKDVFQSVKREATNIINELSAHPFKNKPLGDEKMVLKHYNFW